jgi:hypothetical protein
MRNRIGSVAIILPLVALVLTGCSSKSQTTTFTLQQAKPHLETIPVKPTGHSMGDLVSFVAPVSRDGNPAGVVSGILVTVDLPGDRIGEEELESRVSTIVVRFSPTDCLTLSGSAVYPTNVFEMKTSVPQVRAITGGTGAYIGARGQVTTTRNEDGTYTHVVELLQ